jgi:two-component system, OmpR family, sensor kinase
MSAGLGPAVPADPPLPAPRRPSVWQRTPLWLRLISALLVLTMLALIVTGMFGARILRNYMVDRLDDQLKDAASEVVVDDFIGQTVDVQALPSQYRMAFQDRTGGTIGVVESRLQGDDEPGWPNLTQNQAHQRQLRPFTVPSQRGGGSWRAVAVDIQDFGLRDSNGTPHTVATLLVATSLEDVEATVGSLIHIDLIVGALVLVGLAIAGYLVVRTAMRPLTEIERTAAAIAGGDLSRRIADEDPRTEVGRLGAALNTMLNQIEWAFRSRAESETTARRSEERMRRFVADASHELRTPLTSIRGFAELHRQGAVTDPGEVSHLLSRIEAEATRMGLLVDDLLLLARLDQQRPFGREPVDLVVVANDAVEAARVVAPDRNVRLVTTAPPPAPRASTPADEDPFAAADPGEAGGLDDARDAGGVAEGDAGVIVAGDEPRLRQVVTNLVDNALAHTPPGTAVTVRLSRAERDGRHWAVLEVSDEGPGLTPDQSERVFERFYRTDTARSRAKGGTGLGLSIVAAITAAHGGTVEVDSRPGGGTTFRVLLPLGEPAPAPGPPTPGPPTGPPPPPPTEPPPVSGPPGLDGERTGGDQGGEGHGADEDGRPRAPSQGAP